MSGAERARWAEPLSGAPGSHGLTSLSAISGAASAFPRMDLNFGALNVTARDLARRAKGSCILTSCLNEVMTLSVIVVLSMVVDGQSGSLHSESEEMPQLSVEDFNTSTFRSNWLQGYLLCAAYAVIAVLSQPQSLLLPPNAGFVRLALIRFWYVPNSTSI